VRRLLFEYHLPTPTPPIGGEDVWVEGQVNEPDSAALSGITIPSFVTGAISLFSGSSYAGVGVGAFASSAMPGVNGSATSGISNQASSAGEVAVDADSLMGIGVATHSADTIPSVEGTAFAGVGVSSSSADLFGVDGAASLGANVSTAGSETVAVESVAMFGVGVGAESDGRIAVDASALSGAGYGVNSAETIPSVDGALSTGLASLLTASGDVPSVVSSAFGGVIAGSHANGSIELLGDAFLRLLQDVDLWVAAQLPTPSGGAFMRFGVSDVWAQILPRYGETTAKVQDTGDTTAEVTTDDRSVARLVR